MADVDLLTLWRLTFRLAPGTVPGAHRVRKVLKYALKHGLVSVKQEQIKPEPKEAK